MTSRTRPSTAFLATVGLAVAFAVYVLSFWPVCYLVGSGGGHGRLARRAGRAYYPLLVAAIRLPKSARTVIFPDGGNAAEGVILMGLYVDPLDMHSSF